MRGHGLRVMITKKNRMYTRDDTCKPGLGYYDSETRNRIVASIETAHDLVHEGAALGNESTR